MIRSKTRKCAVCRSPFVKLSMTHKVCSVDCSIELVKRQKQLAEKRSDAGRRISLRTLSDWLKITQREFNAYIRARDADLPCISCNRFHTGAYDAGHYRSVGSNPALRFNDDNCHKQCVPCNQFKSGNAVEYRKGLIAKIGIERVEALEGPNFPIKYTIDEAQHLAKYYKQLKKELCTD